MGCEDRLLQPARRIVLSRLFVRRLLGRFIGGLPMKPATNICRLAIHSERIRHLLDHAITHDANPISHRHRLNLIVVTSDHRRAYLSVKPRDLRTHLHEEGGATRHPKSETVISCSFMSFVVLADPPRRSALRR